MKLYFATRPLQRRLDHRDACIRAYGKDRAKAILGRLTQIRAISTLAELALLPGRFHALTGDRVGQFATTVSANFRLILRPHHDPLPTTPDGALDTRRVTECLVTEIGDYHGD